MRRVVCGLTVSLALSALGCGANSSLNDIHADTKVGDSGKPGKAHHDVDSGVEGIDDGGVPMKTLADGAVVPVKPGHKPTEHTGETDETDETDPSATEVAPTVPGSTAAPTAVSSTAPVSTMRPPDGSGGVGNEPDDTTDEGVAGMGSSETEDPDVTEETDEVTIIEVPSDECSDTGSSGEEGYCNLSVECDGAYGSSYCSSQGDGTYYCECSFQNGLYNTVYVDAVNGVDTCRSVLDICMSGESIQYDGEYECEFGQQGVASDSCYRNNLCTRSTTLANGLTVLDRQNQSVNCYNNGDVIGCNCYDPLSGTSSAVNLVDTTLSKSCSIGAEICWNGMAPTPVSDPVCSAGATGTDDTDDYCSQGLQCEQAVTVGDQAATISTLTTGACREGNGDTWECSCYDGNHAANILNMPKQADSVATCDSAVAICDEVLAAPVSGQITCDISGSQSAQGSCSVGLDCNQKGSVGDLTVSRLSSASISCDLRDSESGEWSCYCYADGASGQTTSVISDVGQDDACMQMLNDCASYVDVTNSYYGLVPQGNSFTDGDGGK